MKRWGRVLGLGCEEFACGSKEELSTLLYLLEMVFGVLATSWDVAGWKIITIAKEHGEKLVTLTSFAFGLWRWWLYRENVLYKRLEEFVRESDRRLVPATNEVVQALLRPEAPIPFAQPAYAIELRRVLNTHGWRSWFWYGGVEGQADREIRNLMSGIRKRERIIEKASASLTEQKALAHLLAGAVYSARARQATGERNDATRADHKSLREFQDVLRAPGHDRNLVAKECEAFQFLRLGKFDRALAACLELEEFARKEMISQRNRHLILSRSRRYRGQITQIQMHPAGSLTAWMLVANGQQPSALDLRAELGPFTKWEAIEQAETHYVAAYIAHCSGYVNEEPSQLEKAAAQYRAILDDLPSMNFLLHKSERALRDAAHTGNKRIEMARRGDYDLYWLSFGQIK